VVAGYVRNACQRDELGPNLRRVQRAVIPRKRRRLAEQRVVALFREAGPLRAVENRSKAKPHDLFAWNHAQVDEPQALTTVSLSSRVESDQFLLQSTNSLGRVYRQGPEKLVHLTIIDGQDKKLVTFAK